MFCRSVSVVMVSLAALLWSTATAAADHDAALPRKSMLGVRFEPAPGGGFRVAEVGAGFTGAALGLRASDRIVEFQGLPVARMADVLTPIDALDAGQQVAMTVLRDGVRVRLVGRTRPRPFEHHAGAETQYGSVPFREGLLRDIFVRPNGVERPPVVFFLQGYPCHSIEARTDSSLTGHLARALVAASFALYRVEKPGVGDSAGGPRCADSDFRTELDAFRTAYRHLVAVHGFEPGRIFLFGHSLGGIEAPLLAAELPPRGVAVYGTVLCDWADYAADLDRYQAFLAQGDDPAGQVEVAARDRSILDAFYRQRRAPAAIAAAAPEAAAALRRLLDWDGGTSVYGRHFSYMQQLPGLPITQAWRDVRSRVLTIYGGSDVVALYDTDHRLIAEAINFYRPGTARFVEIPLTSPAMELVGDRAAYRERNRQAGRVLPGPFNPAVTEVLIDWMKEAMALPPV